MGSPFIFTGIVMRNLVARFVSNKTFIYLSIYLSIFNNYRVQVFITQVKISADHVEYQNSDDTSFSNILL